MNTKTNLFSVGLLCIFTILGASFPALGYMHDAPCAANATTLQQLKSARMSTAAYHSIEAAEKAGYADIHLEIPNMGAHYVNGNLVDQTFEADKPEALVYADLGTGQLQLVAVEYLAPYDPAGPPSGFEGTCDQWSPFPSPEAPVFWTLHAWVWQSNLSGTFAKFNPLMP